MPETDQGLFATALAQFERMASEGAGDTPDL